MLLGLLGASSRVNESRSILLGIIEVASYVFSSATTLIEASRNKRNYMGIESNLEYFNLFPLSNDLEVIWDK